MLAIGMAQPAVACMAELIQSIGSYIYVNKVTASVADELS